MSWAASARATLREEFALLRRHRRLAVALVGLLFVPALYALIVLKSAWDPASHTGALPAGLVNLDLGADYRGRPVNLGAQVVQAIERDAAFAYTRYADREAARRDVRAGRLDFVLEIPPDFSRRALPGEQPGAARLTIYTSEGNDYAAAGFARRFAPEVAQRVNTMLGEARWELVLDSALGSQRSLEALRETLARLSAGATELGDGLQRAREGSAALAAGAGRVDDAAQRLRAALPAVGDATAQLAAGARQTAQTLRAMDARRPSDAELLALRQGSRALVEGQRDLGRGLDELAGGARRLQGGIGLVREAADGLPFGAAGFAEASAPLADGAAQLVQGLERAAEVHGRLLQGQLRLDDGLVAAIDGQARLGGALAQGLARLPDETRLDGFADAVRELQRAGEGLAAGTRTLATSAQALQQGTARLDDGAHRLAAGLELLRGTLPSGLAAPGGSAQGLALSVAPAVEVAAPVPNYGSALTPNFVPLALWIGAVMAAFVVHLRRVPAALAGAPRSAVAAGKLVLPLALVLVQALLMLLLLVAAFGLAPAAPGRFALTLATASATFLAIVFLLVRLLGPFGQVVAVLLIVVQVAGAGALLPVPLSDGAFQALHPYLPLSWVVRAFRASLFGAYDGAFWPAWAVVAATGAAALVLGAVVRPWQPVPPALWRPPLDLD